MKGAKVSIFDSVQGVELASPCGEQAGDDEQRFRRGFDAALRLAAKGKSEGEVEDLIQQECPDLCTQHHFVRGYKRGLSCWKHGHITYTRA